MSSRYLGASSTKAANPMKATAIRLTEDTLVVDLGHRFGQILNQNLLATDKHGLTLIKR